MGCEYFIIGLVISILVLALVGLVTVIRCLFPSERPRNDFDVTLHVAQELFADQALTQEAYAEIVAAIQNARSTQDTRGDATQGHPTRPIWKQRPPHPLAADDAVRPPSDAEIVAESIDPSAEIVIRPKARPPVLGQPVPVFEQADQEIELLDGPSITGGFDVALGFTGHRAGRTTRSWREVFALFMQEKNIRWGEIGERNFDCRHAVGLVLSLRTQLLHVIPYFPYALFLLITAAIIASGVYTLHRWRLQMTSRGILVIGLMLIPLNVLISCWLTGNQQYQRPLDDPIYWIAIFIELTSLAALSWLAAKNLLRVQYWGLVASIMGSASIHSGRESNRRPFGFHFANGTVDVPVCRVLSRRRRWNCTAMNQRFWNRREIRRLMANLGIAFFAVAVGIALFFIKWSSDSLAIAATPVLVASSIATVWLGGQWPCAACNQ